MIALTPSFLTLSFSNPIFLKVHKAQILPPQSTLPHHQTPIPITVLRILTARSHQLLSPPGPLASYTRALTRAERQCWVKSIRVSGRFRPATNAPVKSCKRAETK